MTMHIIRAFRGLIISTSIHKRGGRGALFGCKFKEGRIWTLMTSYNGVMTRWKIRHPKIGETKNQVHIL
jgi:hypothetical protein